MLPRTSSANPPRPRRPVTTRSASSSLAAWMIESAASLSISTTRNGTFALSSGALHSFVTISRSASRSCDCELRRRDGSRHGRHDHGYVDGMYHDDLGVEGVGVARAPFDRALGVLGSVDTDENLHEKVAFQRLTASPEFVGSSVTLLPLRRKGTRSLGRHDKGCRSLASAVAAARPKWRRSVIRRSADRGNDDQRARRVVAELGRDGAEDCPLQRAVPTRSRYEQACTVGEFEDPAHGLLAQ